LILTIFCYFTGDDSKSIALDLVDASQATQSLEDSAQEEDAATDASATTNDTTTHTEKSATDGVVAAAAASAAPVASAAASEPTHNLFSQESDAWRE
jgi:hypothetical protein